MNWFKKAICSHPFSGLISLRPCKQEIDEKGDFRRMTVYFRCAHCGAELQQEWSELVGGVKHYLREDRT